MAPIPQSVREQGARAEEAHQRVYGPKSADDDTATTTEPNPDEIDPTAARSDDDAPPADDTPPARSADDRSNDPDYLRNRLAVLQGKYNAEVGKTARENSELKARLDTLESQLAEQQESKPLDLNEHFSQEELDQFGEETLQLVARTAKRMSDANAQQLRTEFKSDREQDRQQQQQTAEERFIADLNRAVPDWETINADPRFHQWLAQSVEVLTDNGTELRPRQALLEGYQRKANSDAVIKLFEQFKGSAKGERGSDPRAKHVMPETRPDGGRNRPTPGGERHFTRSEVQAHYNPIHRKKMMQKDPEAYRARDREIERAAQDNRIIDG